MINLDHFPIFISSKDTLKETSRDTDSQNVQYMTSHEFQVVNFDKVKTKYANSLGLSEECATSVDAIFSSSEKIFFIEFKNGVVKNREVRDKARDSLLIFFSIVNKNLSFSRKNINYIVVYNKEKNISRHRSKGEVPQSPSRTTIGKSVATLAKTELILFELSKYNKYLFNEIHTFSGDEFEDYLSTILTVQN